MCIYFPLSCPNESKMLRRKPLWVIKEQSRSEHGQAAAVYGLWSVSACDFLTVLFVCLFVVVSGLTEWCLLSFCLVSFQLLAVGVGGAIGSGMFVLSGAIAQSMAGPATALSWLLGGIVCSLTALTYAEMSRIVPSAGSTYSFAYYGLGEPFGVLGAWCLTLEYGISAAAVSRSWGDKCAFFAAELELLGCSFANETSEPECWINSLGGTNVSPAGALLCLVAFLTLLGGVEFGKTAVNVLVVLKLGLVAFVLVVGFAYFDSKNLHPFLPPPQQGDQGVFVGGMHGVLMGCLAAFFGFIGFDEVTSLTLEAVDPKRDIPIAVLGTIIIITVVYILGAVVLTGMVPYHLIDAEEGFGSAFRHVGAEWAVYVVMIGQISVVLPAVVIVSFLPQSRLLASAAKDGLLPKAMARTNDRGNLVVGITVSGIVMTFVGLLVPFRNLNDLISGGILISFNLSNASLLVIRCGNDERALWRTCSFVLFMAALALSVAKSAHWVVQATFGVVALICLARLVPIARRNPETENGFSVPGVPYVPCFAIAVNWGLFSQLSNEGFLQVSLFVAFALCLYIVFRSCNCIANQHHHAMIGDDADRLDFENFGMLSRRSSSSSARSLGVPDLDFDDPKILEEDSAYTQVELARI